MSFREYIETGDYIKSRPEFYKVCLQCGTVNPSTGPVCKVCRGYRFDESPVSVFRRVTQLQKAGARGEVYACDPP